MKRRNKVMVTGLLLSVFAMACLLCFGIVNRSTQVNWRQAEAALESNDVKTIRDYFARLSEGARSEREKNWYADVEAREREFGTLEGHIAQNVRNYHKSPGITPDDARKMLAKEITWKDKERASVDDVKRRYLEGMSRPSRIDQMSHWGTLIYVEVFTDDDGVILGWKINKENL